MKKDSFYYKRFKLFTAAILMVFSIHGFSQSSSRAAIKRFHMEISTGLAIPSGLKAAGIDLGGLLSIEPRYVISQNLKVGLRMEAAIVLKNIRPSGEWFESNNMEQSGYMLTADYMYKKLKNAQIFYGGGAGIIDITNDDQDPITPSIQYIQTTTYAGMIRGGIEFNENKLRAGIEYNLIGPVSFSRINHYLSFKFGMMLFTQKKKSSS